MSLNITLVNSFGMWQCSDHRLVDTTSGRIIDDYSIKHVQLRCPDGTAVIAYAGIGRLEGVDISDWIREILRGETRTVDQSLIFLRENATRDLGPRCRGRWHHMFTVAAFLQGRPWMAQIRNFNPVPGNILGPASCEFQTVAMQLAQGVASVFPPLVSAADAHLLQCVAPRRPRRPEEFAALLAAINRRTASSGPARKIVSPHCMTTYVPPAGEPIQSKGYSELRAEQSRTLTIPFLLFGIDTTDTMRALQAATAGATPLLQNLETSVEPKNRLRHPS